MTKTATRTQVTTAVVFLGVSAAFAFAAFKTNVKSTQKTLTIQTPFWEQEWKKIRTDILARYHTGSMVKFNKTPGCATDPIKDDVFLRYGRALLKEDYKTATKELKKWAAFQSCMSANTARVYDLALSAFAKGVLTDPLSGQNAGRKTFQKGKLAGKSIEQARLDGLKVAMNPGIMNCDLLIHTGGCIFQRTAKIYKNLFEMVAVEYPNQDMGLQCVDYAQNRLNQYGTLVKIKPGTRVSVGGSALSGVLNTYFDSSLQGLTSSCTSCDMIQNDFFCGRGLPTCVEGATGPGGSRAPIPGSGGATQGAAYQSAFQALTSGGQTGSAVPAAAGDLSNAESQARSCSSPSGMSGRGGGSSLGKALGSCLLGGGFSDRMAGQIAGCASRYRGATALPTTPQGLLSRAFEQSWSSVRDSGCQVSAGGFIDLRTTRDLGAGAERNNFLDTLSRARDILRQDDSMGLLQDSCTAGGVATCDAATLGNVIDDWASRLANGEAGIATENPGGQLGSSASDTALTGMNIVDRALVAVNGHRAGFTVGTATDPGVVAHELGHLVLGDRRIGIPDEENSSSQVSGEHGSNHHDALYQTQCNASPQSSRVCNLHRQEQTQTPPQNPPASDCNPDAQNCGCSGLSQAMDNLIDCTSDALQGDEAPRDKLESLVNPSPEDGGAGIGNFSNLGCLGDVVRGEGSDTVSVYGRSNGPGVTDCDIEGNFCGCFSCGDGGLTSRASNRCEQDRTPCPEGTQRNPVNCQCESTGGDGPIAGGNGPQPD